MAIISAMIDITTRSSISVKARVRAGDMADSLPRRAARDAMALSQPPRPANERPAAADRATSATPTAAQQTQPHQAQRAGLGHPGDRHVVELGVAGRGPAALGLAASLPDEPDVADAGVLAGREA